MGSRMLLAAPLLFAAMVLSAPLAADEVPSAEALALGKSLYREKCRDCHGSRANLKALGQSERLNTLETDAIIAKLRAVQAEANPSTPPDIAKSGLSEDEIQALGIYIHSLQRKRRR